MVEEQNYMRRAIRLAKQGIPWASPNPLVGAVIVKKGRVIGEGCHARCGGMHAERAALEACTEDPAGATVYVTLEPCCHQGRQPPCTQALIESGVARVVVGSRDPNPKVAGRGIAQLRAAGVAVEKDFLRRECDALNPVFFHYITARTPYVALKYAMTADGKLAARTGRSQWITGETARAHVHSLRSRYRAILVGVGTILADDPLLNCRMEGGRDPLRVVLDSRLRTPLSARVCRTAQTQKTIFVCAVENAQKRAQLQALGAEVLCLGGADGRVDWVALMRELGAREIDSVLIEGGAEIQYSALCAGVVQRLYVYVGAMLLGGAGAKSPVGGLGAPDPAEAFALSAPEIELFGRDVLLSYDVLAREKEAFSRCSPELWKKSARCVRWCRAANGAAFPSAPGRCWKIPAGATALPSTACV